MIVFSCGCTTYEDVPITQSCECGGFQVAKLKHRHDIRRTKKGRVHITCASFLDVLESKPSQLIVMNFEPVLLPMYSMQRMIADLNCPYMKAIGRHELQVVIAAPAPLQPYVFYQARSLGSSVNTVMRSNGTCLMFLNTDIRTGSLRNILNNLKSRYILFGNLPAGVVPVEGSEIVVEQEYRYTKLIGG